MIIFGLTMNLLNFGKSCRRQRKPSCWRILHLLKVVGKFAKKIPPNLLNCGGNGLGQPGRRRIFPRTLLKLQESSFQFFLQKFLFLTFCNDNSICIKTFDIKIEYT